MHGLRGHRINTWQDNDVLWPRDLLPQDIKNARIMTVRRALFMVHMIAETSQWGYDSDVARIKNLASQNNIFGHSENLLGDVLNERRAIPDVSAWQDVAEHESDVMKARSAHHIRWTQPWRSCHQSCKQTKDI